MADGKFMGLSKTQMVFVGIGGAAVVFMVYRHNKAAAASAAAVTATTDPNNAGANNIDPTTGLPYGSQADQAALAQSGYAVGSVGTSGYPPYSSNPQMNAPATNAQWAQSAQQLLSAIGYDPETTAGALGAYLSHIPLTPTQANIVQVAVAEAGPPPQGSYPIIPQGGGAGGTGNNGTPLPAPGNVHVTNKTAHEFSLAWTPVQGAHDYRVKVTQLNGVAVADFQVPGPGCTVSANTHPGFTYHVGIQALPGGTGTNTTVSLPSK